MQKSLDEWRKATPLTEKWLTWYQYQFERNKPVDPQIAENKSKLKVQPNKMQKEALGEIQSLRQNGKNKALIISATGTGKTYLGAFDVQKFKPNLEIVFMMLLVVPTLIMAYTVEIIEKA